MKISLYNPQKPSKTLTACSIKLTPYKSRHTDLSWNLLRNNKGKVAWIQVCKRERWFCKSIKTSKMDSRNNLTSKNKKGRTRTPDLSKLLTKEEMTLKVQ
jgi:hypothetical protein